MAKTNMDSKAGNHGDRMKHSLLLEILSRIAEWPEFVYAETHAGAGIYRASDQSKENHIGDLAEIVDGTPHSSDDPGDVYLRSLREWWSDPSNRSSYPGSALTVKRWLEKHIQRDSWCLRLTEADKNNCARLNAALNSESDAKPTSFSSELDWLTASNNLVLLVDPFGIITSFDENEFESGIERGWIDHRVVHELLNRCLSKHRAILSVWWGYGQALRIHHLPTCDLLTQFSDQYDGVTCRIFHDKRNHANALVGFGAAAEVVRDIPSRKEWSRSWLGDTVYERNN